MAALPGAPALPLPVLTTTLLATLYMDTERDPTLGDWGDTLKAFSIDAHNAAGNIPTNELRQMTTPPTSASDNPAGFVIISGGVGRIYTTITHLTNTLANRNPSLHDTLFAIKGELINDHGHMVEVERTVFNILTTAVRIPTVAAILITITTDPNIAEMGLYVAGDTDVKTVKVRKICPAPPHTLGGHKEVTWQTYFKVMYPVITTEGREATYTLLTTSCPLRQGPCDVLRQHHPVGSTST